MKHMVSDSFLGPKVQKRLSEVVLVWGLFEPCSRGAQAELSFKALSGASWWLTHVVAVVGRSLSSYPWASPWLLEGPCKMAMVQQEPLSPS